MPPRTAIPLEEIAARVDIVEVIGEYVPLKPAGKDFSGLCPFHSEKTPSFTVSPDKQLFYCFGCQAGGNVYHFLMRYKGLSFREAVEEVGRRAGLSPDALGYSEADRAAWERRQRALAACQAAWEFFRRALHSPAGEAARTYLQGRGMGREAVETFGLGYAPADPGLLEHALRQQGISREAASDAGLLAGQPARASSGESEPGRATSWRPRFRHRLMFPIRDVRGQVVGFGARKLAEGDWGPKYLNSPQSLIFNKRHLLFGLWEARRSVREHDTALLVEGYTDVIALHTRGIPQAVATLGTALTEEQARLLQRYCRQVIVAFDADTAGEHAALKGLKTLSAAGLRVRVMTLPRGLDPDEFVTRYGREAFVQRMEQAVALTEFRLRMALRGHRLDTVDGRGRAVAAVLPILAELESAVELEGYIQRLSDALGVSAQAIWHDLERLRQVPRPTGPQAGLEASRHRDRLVTNSHNKKGFAPPYGEHKGGAWQPGVMGGGRRGEGSRHGPLPPAARQAGVERRSAAGEKRPEGLERAERMLVRRMLEGPVQTLQVLEYLAGAQPVDSLLQDVVRHLEVRARQPGMDADGWRASTGDSRLDACLERLRRMEPPLEGEWRAYADRLVEYRLREQLRDLGGRLRQEAESAGDEMDGAELARLMELLLEYHELRRRIAGVGKGRRSPEAPGHHR